MQDLRWFVLLAGVHWQAALERAVMEKQMQALESAHSGGNGKKNRTGVEELPERVPADSGLSSKAQPVFEPVLDSGKRLHF